MFVLRERLEGGLEIEGMRGDKRSAMDYRLLSLPFFGGDYHLLSFPFFLDYHLFSHIISHLFCASATGQNISPLAIQIHGIHIYFEI